jgi:Mg-chelatase subunit ChlD
MSSLNKNVKDIIFVLDESSSMNSMGNEPKQAVNAFIKEQKNALDDGSKFTLWKFHSDVTLVIDRQPLGEIKEFTDFNPQGMTALFDAIGMAIHHQRENSNTKAVCVILTDGEENVSKKYKKKEITKLIKKMETKHGWDIVYLGANQNAFSVGSSIGMSKEKCSNYECVPGELAKVCRMTSDAVARYRELSSEGLKVELNLDAKTSP